MASILIGNLGQALLSIPLINLDAAAIFNSLEIFVSNQFIAFKFKLFARR